MTRARRRRGRGASTPARRHAVAASGGSRLAARGVVAVDERAQRPERGVLGERHADSERTGLAPVRRRTARRRARTRRRSPRGSRGRPPASPPRDRLAEQRDVRVVAAEDPPVERLLGRPDEGRRRSCRCCACVMLLSGYAMPEGDALHRAARRLQPLVGEEVEVETPHPRAQDGIAERVDGRRSLRRGGRQEPVLTFDGRVVLRSHLRMTGRWTSCRAGLDAARRPWLVVRGTSRRRAVERPRARAPRARNAPPRPGHPRRGAGRRPDAGEPPRRDLRPGGRRRPARPAPRRGDREQVEGRGALGGGGLAVAAARRRDRRGAPRRASRPPPVDAPVA